MNVTIPHAAWGTHLSFKGSTCNADATIELPSTFAGTVNLAGSKFSSMVSGWTDDPTGHGYQQKMKTPRLHLYQTWYESEKDLDLGHVDLRTVNGAAAGLILSADSTWRPPRDEALP